MTTQVGQQYSPAEKRLRIGQALMSGDLFFDHATDALRIIRDEEKLRSSPYAALSPSHWGYVYAMLDCSSRSTVTP